MADNSLLGFLNGRHARVLTGVLALQAVGLLAISHQERVPLIRPLQEFPRTVGNWMMLRESGIDKDTTDVLKADDLLSRVYADQRGAASLFIAFFKSQRTGQAPHSPKNCLPGSGWVPSESDIVPIQVPGRSEPIRINRYLVSKGDEKSVVLYWYQSRDRVVASEYAAKFYLVADAIRYNRTDTALVRVVVPIAGNDVDGATATARDFVQAFFVPLRTFLPE